MTRTTLLLAALIPAWAFGASFPPQYTDGSTLIVQHPLDGGFAAAVYGPAVTTPNQTTTVTVQLLAPQGGRLVFGVVAFGYEHTAAGANYGALPYGSYCPASGNQCKQFLTSSPNANWVSPLVALAPPSVIASLGAFVDHIIVPNLWMRFPDSTPFSKANDYDWQGGIFVGDEALRRIGDANTATGGASMVAITCPLLLHRADASIAIWIAARAIGPNGSLRITRYMPVTLTANPAPAVAAAPPPTEAPVVTSPKEGDRVGPNFDVVGTAQPTAVVVISIDIVDAQTGEVIRSIPGNRHLPEPSGAFNLRIAAPRPPDDNQRPFVYRVHIRSEGMNFKSPETLINVYPEPGTH